MGQVISWPLVENAILDIERESPKDFRYLSNEERQRAISGCREVRRQIEMLLRLVTDAENVISNLPDLSLRRRLREKRTISRVQLVNARARVSLTIAALIEAVSTNAIV